MKIRIDLTEEQHDELLRILHEYVEGKNDYQEIQEGVELCEYIDNNYKEIEDINL